MYSCKQWSVRTLLYKHGGNLWLAISTELVKNQSMKSSSTKDTFAPTCDDSEWVSAMQQWWNIYIRIVSPKMQKHHWHRNITHYKISGIPWPTSWESAHAFDSRWETDTAMWTSRACPPLTQRKRFFPLCALHFCTDHRCSMPLHTLLIDIMEICGVSSDIF